MAREMTAWEKKHGRITRMTTDDMVRLAAIAAQMNSPDGQRLASAMRAAITRREEAK